MQLRTHSANRWMQIVSDTLSHPKNKDNPDTCERFEGIQAQNLT